MFDLVVLALVVVCAVLWQRTGRLQARLEGLEDGRGVVEPVWMEAPMEVAPPMPQVQPLAERPLEAEPPVKPREPVRRPKHPRPGFEDVFGRRLPIWAGGITLAVAGVLIVKYSIDAGLISPAVRVLMGLVFGGGLIGAAGWARRRADQVPDPRIAQALAGAGIASLYGSVVAAATLYGLIGSATAFAGLVGVTALAAGLSLRFGAPSAVLGLLGGLAAPALVGSGPPDVPLLSAYLALVVGGLCALGRSQRWWWLGAAALVGGFGWGVVLLATGALSVAATLSLGAFTLLLAVGFPLLFLGGGARAVSLLGALAGLAQMAALVALGGFAPLTWGLYALLSVAVLWLARSRGGEAGAWANLPAAGLTLTLLLAAVWPSPSEAELRLVLGGIGALYGGAALWRLAGGGLGAGRLIDAGQLAALAGAVLAVPLVHFLNAPVTLLSLLGAGIAVGSAAVALRFPGDERRLVVLASAGGVMLVLAAAFGLPEWCAAPAAALVAAGLLALGRHVEDRRVSGAAGLFSLGAAALLTSAGGQGEIARAFGETSIAADPIAALRWAVVAGVEVVFARFAPAARVRAGAQTLAVVLGVGALSQLVPLALLPVLAVAVLAGLVAVARRGVALWPALATAGAVSVAWALMPLAQWTFIGALALVGEPMLLPGLRPVLDALTRLLLPGLALGAALWAAVVPQRARAPVIALAGALAVVPAHIVWKQLFAIGDLDRFVALGLAERTMWQALLAGGALIAARTDRRGLAVALGALGLAHFAWFTVVLHDPLWAEQVAGPWLLGSAAVAGGLLWAAGRDERLAGRPLEVARMALVAIASAWAVRQLSTDGLIAGSPVGASESIGWSITGIALALAFLWWGLRRQRAEWRLASLGLMLLAVAKVFLFDAAGLDGLARIASFAALGFSLIGVGWLYSRLLPSTASTPLTEPA